MLPKISARQRLFQDASAWDNGFPSNCNHWEVYRMKKYMCLICGFIYDEEKGWLGDGIPPGTRWEDVPADWICPECGVTKDDFEMVEI